PAGPPVHAERPARQGLAGIPLALADVQERSRTEAMHEALREHPGELTLPRRMCSDAPLGTVHVVDRHEGRLTALCEPDIVRLELGVDALSERVDGLPVGLGGRLGG